MPRQSVILFFSLLFALNAQGQTDRLILDSITPLLKRAKNDTTRLYYLSYLAENIYDESLWPLYNDSALALATQVKSSEIESEKTAGLKYLATALNNKGFLYHTHSDYSRALEYYKDAYSVSGEAGYRAGQAQVLGNIGNLYDEQGEVEKAMDYYRKALQMQRALRNKIGIAQNLNNIGYIYYKQGQIAKALSHYEQSLKLKEEEGDNRGMAYSLNNIASVYEAQEDVESALDYYSRSRDLYTQLGDREGLGTTWNNLGNLLKHKGELKHAEEAFIISIDHFAAIGNKLGEGLATGNLAAVLDQQGRLEEAREKLFAAIEIHTAINDHEGLAGSNNKLAQVYLKEKNYKNALKHALKGYEFAKLTGFPEDLRDASEVLAHLYSLSGNYKKANEKLQEFYLMRDSLRNDENRKLALKQQLRYAYHQKHFADSLTFAESQKIKDALLEKQKARLESAETTRYAMGSGILLLLVLSLVSYRAYAGKKKSGEIILKQKNEVEIQKRLVEEKNREVTDSINYARRIQDAMLPSQQMIVNLLPASFVLYLPKDIVAGDFYWVEEAGNKVFVAACDCTGHGVPGAMVSVIASNALHRSVKEFNLSDPGLILDKVNSLVEDQFSKSGSEVRDGMDVALCVFDRAHPGRMSFAGANNPLWIIRDGEVIVHKGDKQPIGKTDNRYSFTVKGSDLITGDMVYLFSDGYADQFGGPSGKKLKTTGLRKLLLEASALPVSAQKEFLESSFADWKRTLNQVDDVCLIGIRV